MTKKSNKGAPDSDARAADRPSLVSSRLSLSQGQLVRVDEPTPGEVVLASITAFVEHMGQVGSMFAGALRAGTRRPFETKAILAQIYSVGVTSVGIVAVSSLFIGMVMAVQFAFGLQKFGGMEYAPRVVALSFARELAPTLTSIIVGGRIGSGMAAEVGSMNVTEQIDAVRALGADPLKKLVWPRLVASTLAMPLLCTLALILGIGGAMFITATQFDIPASFFFQSALGSVKMSDFLSGLYKTPVFGALIALIGCHLGMQTRGGTAGVGNSTTRSVVAISITIFVADFVLTKLAILLWPNS
jgi:phospholipid/cholesterol/gamma-HCH transport system permease protein